MKMMNPEIVVSQCEGCQKVIEKDGNKFCVTYLVPKAKWRAGACPVATHLKKEVTNGKFVDPLKASKKAVKKI